MKLNGGGMKKKQICRNKVGVRYRERTIRNHHVYVREFVDMDGGCHFMWTLFSISGKIYPVGSFDILRAENIDWGHTKVIEEGD